MKRTKQRVWAEGRAIAAQLPDESDAVVLEDHDFSTSDDEDRTPKGRATGDLLRGTSSASVPHAGSASEQFLRMGYQEDGRQASPERQRDMSDRDVLEKGLYIILISMHGLVRGDRMELGKDPDTGGQVRGAPFPVLPCPFQYHRDALTSAPAANLCKMYGLGILSCHSTPTFLNLHRSSMLKPHERQASIRCP